MSEQDENAPDRIAQRRKTAERIAADTVEYSADDPSRQASTMVAEIRRVILGVWGKR